MDRDVNLDVLRVLACLTVIMLHTSARTIYLYGDVSTLVWNAGNLVSSATRWCVPVFVMISGALVLRRPVDEPWSFYRRRVARVGIPLLFWCAAYLAWRWYTQGETFTPLTAAKAVFSGQPYYHLYFLFLIAGLYLFTPAVAAAVNALPRATAMSTALIALLLAFLVVTLSFWSPNALTFFVPYLGYFVMGGLLAQASPFSSRAWTVLLVAAIGLTALLTSLLVRSQGGVNGTWSLYFYNYFSPTTMAAALAVFVLVCRARVPERAAAWSVAIAPLTLGMYLVHPMVLEALRRVWGKAAPPLLWPVLDVPVTFVATAVISGLIVAVLSRIPGLRATV